VSVLVRIYEVQREWSTVVWLCDNCAAARAALIGALKWRVGRPKLMPPNNIRVIDGACPVDFHDRIVWPCIDCDANRPLAPA